MGYALAAILICGAIGWVIYYVSPPVARKRRSKALMAAWQQDLAAAQAWMRLCSAEMANPNLRVAHVTECYGVYPRSGTKAWITWRQPQAGQDAWFDMQWPTQGCWVLLQGETGYGPHNDNPDTFFVDHWLDVAPPGAPEAYQRCATANWAPPVPRA